MHRDIMDKENTHTYEVLLLYNNANLQKVCLIKFLFLEDTFRH